MSDDTRPIFEQHRRQDRPEQQERPPLHPWSVHDILLYNNELIASHAATTWFVAIISYYKQGLYRFLKRDDDKLRLALCIAHGIQRREGRFLAWEGAAWRQLDVIDATMFIRQALERGFGSTRQQEIPSIQEVTRYGGIGEFVTFNSDEGDANDLGNLLDPPEMMIMNDDYCLEEEEENGNNFDLLFDDDEAFMSDDPLSQLLVL